MVQIARLAAAETKQHDLNVISGLLLPVRKRGWASQVGLLAA